MGLAPRPGVGKRDEAAKAARESVTITLRGESHTVFPMNVPLRHAAAFRKATGGQPIRRFLPSDSDLFDIDCFKALWWLGRRLDGEPDLTFEQLDEDWPTDLSAEDIEAFVTTPDDEEGDEADPEG